MKIGENVGRYALGILGGSLPQGNPLSGGLRTMLAIQQERKQRKHQEKLVDKLVSGLSKNASGGSPGQTYKAPKDWNKDTLKSPKGKPQDPPPIGTPLPKASINPNREMLLADLRDPDTNKNYRYHPRTGKVSVDGQYLDGGGSPGPDVPGKIMPHPKASINPNRGMLMASIKDPVRLKNLQDLVLYDRV
tara:strand:- start:329 stop:898 length:570 start_codon:yes stop_codon:yes gene_type:complete